MPPNLNRLNKEFADNTTKAKQEGVQKIEVVNDNMAIWKVFIDGPLESPFTGGTFQVEINFEENYPFKAPKVRFLTKIYHPGIKQDTGEICA